MPGRKPHNKFGQCLLGTDLVSVGGVTMGVIPTYLLTYSMALVRKRTIPTERPPLVGELNANFCG
jgi:hypothetical protein